MRHTLPTLLREEIRVPVEYRRHALTDAADPASILDLLSEAVIRYRVADHVITYCNAAWAAQYGVDRHSAIGSRLDNFLSPDELEGLRAQLAMLGPDQPVLIDKVPRAAHSHAERWMQWVDRFVTTANGPEVLSVGRDVTERRLAVLRLEESQRRFKSLADNSSDVVWQIRTTPVPHFDYLSPSVETVLGYPPAFFLDDFERILEVADAETQDLILRLLGQDSASGRFDLRFRHANGQEVIGETTITVDKTSMQGVVRDVTELRRTWEVTAAQALADPLTGVSNRRGFDQVLRAEMRRTSAAGCTIAVAYLDVDELKEINDVHGHDAGDRVLRETARRLKAATAGVQGSPTVARLGGDEFAVIFEPAGIAASDLVKRIDELMTAPIEISESAEVRCGVSIGVADTGRTGRRAADLVAAADHAMYIAKQSRGRQGRRASD